jgi:hypothetical protein
MVFILKYKGVNETKVSEEQFDSDSEMLMRWDELASLRYRGAFTGYLVPAVSYIDYEIREI